jgi:allantoate deiminase
VVVAIAAIQRLHRTGTRLPFAIEVIAFTDEEGLRFGSSYLGSRAVAGTLAPADLERRDAQGITVAEAIREFGGDPDRIQDDRWAGARPLGYVEVHIEQGPVLEGLDLPLGIVSAISGQNRFWISFQGEAGHAGTVPMTHRRDALVVAAMFVVAVEQEAIRRPGLVATVGKLDVHPGAANVIPGRVELSLDVRHPDDDMRLEACRRLLSDAHGLAEGRHVAVDVRPLSEDASVPCAPGLVDLWTRAVEAGGLEAVKLPSGAGHDGVAMSAVADVGMLFVRCKGGVSHNPAESVAVQDVAAAIDALGRFVELLARQ